MVSQLHSRSFTLLDLIVLLGSPLIASSLVLLLPINLLFATILFFAPQALYMSWRRKNIIMPAFVYAGAATVISIITDYLAERDNSWVSTSMFQFRIAGAVPIEALVWIFALTYTILAYFLYFFITSPPRKPLGARMPYVLLAAVGVLVWLGSTTFANTHFTVEYFYIKSGIFFLTIPLVGFVICFPQYLKILLQIVPYFFALGLLNLLVSLQAGHWSYPGAHFVGWVQLGTYRFPIEELLFWIILYAPFVVTQFEFFTNDKLTLKTTKNR